MRKKGSVLFLCLLLTGCWDQLQLKKLLFVDVVGIDYADNQQKLKVDFIISSLQEANQGGGKPSSLFIGSSGSSLYEAVAKTNKELSGNLSVLETRLYLISPRFARDKPLSYLDSTAQFMSNPLYAYLALYDGDLSELLGRKTIKERTVPDFLIGLLDDEKERGKIPSNKLLHYILGGTEFRNDFALNRFEPYQDGVRLSGTSLFTNGKYTGINLTNEQTQLANLLDGAAGRSQLIIGEVNNDNYSAFVQGSKRSIRVIAADKDVKEVDIELKVELKLVEQDLNREKYTDEKLAELEKGIAQNMESLAEEVFATLKKANCDYFQLAHEIAAHHPRLYRGMNWEQEYPKLRMKPIVKVTILNSGILES
ncbi:Ger(x)C family spore germination protein [Cohnella sp. AR92]|uniref:Ger(x)C family spore germination protein n=1 Tax=Cohnella sp. AR92 TaxID=648716 RepID=UPI000F8E53E4|nr:Ger(x)C family spore germination protein [Cohnella sp. AR92]RUS46937.1 Ger(x)C family spore germination protein [Cohnella sp. AR92]